MLLEGLGTEKNYVRAYELFMDAANNNDSMALNGLGYIFLYGLG